jgi:uncharacterized RDD family membrane protein YckC
MCAGVIALIAQSTGYESTGQMELVLSVYALYHAAFYWLSDGQTPGLRIFDVRTVSAIGGLELSPGQALVRAGFRPLLLYVLGWVVNSAGFPVNVVVVIVLAPPLCELGMMFTLPSRQTLSDLLSGTLVVNVPPPQPHRAPAVPMYSATDAEFGVPPRRIK